MPMYKHITVGLGAGGGKTVPHFLQRLLASRKLKEWQVGHFIGLSFGGLQPPQYGLQDQHMVFSPIHQKPLLFRESCSNEYSNKIPYSFIIEGRMSVVNGCLQIFAGCFIEGATVV